MRETRNRVLIVDDEESIRMAIRRFLTSAGFEVAEADDRPKALAEARRMRPDAVILDYKLRDCTALDLLPQLKTIDPSVAVIVLTAHGSVELAVAAIKEGAEQFLTKPVDLSTLLVILNRTLESQRSRQVDEADRKKESRDLLDPFTGSSAAIRALAEDTRKVVATDRPVLVQGETGTGKGILAHWMHRNGNRAQEPFVDLNCAGLSRDFLESELFGHERGAFTGAVQAKQGLFDLAHRGTLFLDEIGDVDLQVQPKLLKVLEEQRFRRLGETRDRSVNVRLIAATHQNLLEAQSSRRFREDLYFRISTIRLVIPPLRERPDDILPLSDQFRTRFAAELGRGEMAFDKHAEDALRGYAWPGNIRELRNVIERAVLLARSTTLSERDLSFESRPAGGAAPNFDDLTLDQIEKLAVERALTLEHGRVERAAARLGLARSSLYHRIHKFAIDLSRF